MNHQPKFELAATVKDVAEVFARASAFHQAGDLAQAQAGYIEILQQQPGHFGALHMLGVSEQQLGNLQTAERLLRHSLRVDPRSAASHFALGVVVSALQRNDEALACYDEVVALTPDFVHAHMKRGLLLAQLGRFTDAIASYDDAIAIDPQHADAHLLKGEALHYLGRFDDAIACYDRILSTQPDHFGAVVDRACAFKDSGRAVAAIAELDRALLLAPDNTIVLVNRGEARRALNQDAEALEDFDRVIAIDPRNVNAWLGRANILILGRNASEALRASESALALDPNSFKALTLIGEYHASLGDAEAARSFFDRALAIKPDDEAALLNKIFALDFCTGGFAPQQAARSEWWRRIGPKIAVDHPPRHDNDRDPARRVTLGYVSGDFRTHSAARVFRPVLQNHDKSRFEIICYYNSFQQDDVTDSFRHVADRWRDVLDWSDERLADHIRADKVDILIDLSGMTFGHRLPVFGRKPAPIQVTAWGHASGTGMPAMDYLFTDPVSVPMEVGDLFAEQIYHLPCSIIIEPPPPGLRAAAPR